MNTTETPTAVSSMRLLGQSERKAHTLKTWPEFLNPIGMGIKTFEIRKKDRDFRVGDILHLREWHNGSQEWGPRSITCFITFILDGPRFGLEEGFCIMAIKLPANHTWPNHRTDAQPTP